MRHDEFYKTVLAKDLWTTDVKWQDGQSENDIEWSVCWDTYDFQKTYPLRRRRIQTEDGTIFAPFELSVKVPEQEIDAGDTSQLDAFLEGFEMCEK